MINYEITILNQWGEEEYCFFVQSNKSEEEIMADIIAVDLEDNSQQRIANETFHAQC